MNKNLDQNQYDTLEPEEIKTELRRLMLNNLNVTLLGLSFTAINIVGALYAPVRGYTFLFLFVAAVSFVQALRGIPSFIRIYKFRKKLKNQGLLK